jgi:hypothetical protein
MSFLWHNTNKSEHPAAFIFVLVQAAGRDIGIGPDLQGVFPAFNMQ